MAFFQFKRSQLLAASLPAVWDFISSPANLKRITPDYMGFDITSGDLPEKMYAGMIISYSVKPVLGIPTTWVTEITQIKENAFFIDEQRVGPYTLWHHQHHIKETPDGVLMDDIISYVPPFGPIGWMVNPILVKPKLNEIFEYRRQVLEEIFPNHIEQKD